MKCREKCRLEDDPSLSVLRAHGNDRQREDMGHAIMYVGLAIILAALLPLGKVWLGTDWPLWSKATAHAILMVVAVLASVMLLGS